MRRQQQALVTIETHEAGEEGSRLAAIEEADHERTRSGRPPLKTETEFHRKAAARGLICR